VGGLRTGNNVVRREKERGKNQLSYGDVITLSLLYSLF